MAGAEDIEVVRRFYEALAAQDLDALLEVVSPDIVITQDERLPWGGRWEGIEGLAGFGAALSGAITSQVATIAVFATDTEVVQMGHTRGTTVASGTAFDIPEVHRWQVRDGRGVAAHFSIDTEAMLAVLDG